MMNDMDLGLVRESFCSAAQQIAYDWKLAAVEHQEHAMELKRPFYMLRPQVFTDGNQWCALYGEDLQRGVCAFGDTPALAAKAFDAEWLGASLAQKGGE
jgi:hypothetical protein